MALMKLSDFVVIAKKFVIFFRMTSSFSLYLFLLFEVVSLSQPLSIAPCVQPLPIFCRTFIALCQYLMFVSNVTCIDDKCLLIVCF